MSSIANTEATTQSETPAADSEQPRQRRSQRLVFVTIVLTLSLFVGIVLGAAWISTDDMTRNRVFAQSGTPIPTAMPTPEIALPYAENAQAAGYIIWELADLTEWLILNNSTSSSSLREAETLLEDHLRWSRAEHPILNTDEEAAVNLIRTKINTVVEEQLQRRDFQICFFVHPDERFARILELGLRLPQEHAIQFSNDARFVPEADFERYLLLERYERTCTSPTPPEKR